MRNRQHLDTTPRANLRRFEKLAGWYLRAIIAPNATIENIGSIACEVERAADRLPFCEHRDRGLMRMHTAAEARCIELSEGAP